MNKLKTLILSTGVGILLVMAAATIVEAQTSSAFVASHIYGSWWFVLMWAILSVASVCYMVRVRLWRMPVTMLLHVALFVVLCGALTTHIFSQEGKLSLMKGQICQNDLPFMLQLHDFEVRTYPGTDTPMDFVSTLLAGEEGDTLLVSMNHVGHYRGFRFYQKGYDPHRCISVLKYTYDPLGITITYTGYALLLFCLFAFFFQKGSRFRRLLRGETLVACLLLALFPTLQANAQGGRNTQPQILPPEVAEDMASLHILHQGRIALFDTFAQDYVTKLTGKRTYRGRTATEVTGGWMIYPDTWKPEPMIRIKGNHLKEILGTESSHVALTDFASSTGDYLLTPLLERIQRGEDIPGENHILSADERVNLLSGIITQSAVKLFPVRDKGQAITWYSPVDQLPGDLPTEQWVFIRKSLTLLAEDITMGRVHEAREVIAQIRRYQQHVLRADAPTPAKDQAESLYNRLSLSRPWAMGSLALGVVSLIMTILNKARGRRNHRLAVALLYIAVAALLAYLTLCLTLRYVVSGHVPFSNGFETMQAMAWCCFLMAVCWAKRHIALLPLSLLVGGCSLFVATIGQSNPTITSLMPVLNSPLLSLHVMVIMVAYALLAFTAVNALTALLFHLGGMHAEVVSIRRSSLLMLYPAVFLLATGIFIGAVWANISWGRYWGWDPKEVWALITLLLYAAPLHGSLTWLRRPLHFHVFVLLAFLSVLMTYFGVNYFLTGMHSYA